MILVLQMVANSQFPRGLALFYILTTTPKIRVRFMYKNFVTTCSPPTKNYPEMETYVKGVFLRRLICSLLDVSVQV